MPAVGMWCGGASMPSYTLLRLAIEAEASIENARANIAAFLLASDCVLMAGWQLDASGRRGASARRFIENAREKGEIERGLKIMASPLWWHGRVNQKLSPRGHQPVYSILK